MDLIPERCSSKAYARNRCAVMSPGDTIVKCGGGVLQVETLGSAWKCPWHPRGWGGQPEQPLMAVTDLKS